MSAICRDLTYSTPQCYQHRTTLYGSTFILWPLNPFTICSHANPITLVTTNTILAPNNDHSPASEEGSHKYLPLMPSLRSPQYNGLRVQPYIRISQRWIVFYSTGVPYLFIKPSRDVCWVPASTWKRVLRKACLGAGNDSESVKNASGQLCFLLG